MKHLRPALGMVCFVVGFLMLTGGVLAAFVALYAFSAADLHRIVHRPFSDMVAVAIPGFAVARVGILLLFTARAIDENGAVRRYARYGKRGRRKRAHT